MTKQFIYGSHDSSSNLVVYLLIQRFTIMDYEWQLSSVTEYTSEIETNK